MIMRDGFSTTIEFTVPNKPIAPIVFYEKEVKPPGWDSGGRIDTSGMWNSRYRTGAPKALMTPTSITAVVAYDPSIVDNIRLMAGVIGDLLVWFPDGEHIQMSGCWLDKFEPNPHVEGTQPTATITIEIGNSTNGLPSGEVRPVFVPAP